MQRLFGKWEASRRRSKEAVKAGVKEAANQGGRWSLGKRLSWGQSNHRRAPSPRSGPRGGGIDAVEE